MRIEGIPVIIRFKTINTLNLYYLIHHRIEGIPVIIRFKTFITLKSMFELLKVLKVFQL